MGCQMLPQSGLSGMRASSPLSVETALPRQEAHSLVTENTNPLWQVVGDLFLLENL